MDFWHWAGMLLFLMVLSYPFYGFIKITINKNYKEKKDEAQE
jgi:hypothetical protein